MYFQISSLLTMWFWAIYSVTIPILESKPESAFGDFCAIASYYFSIIFLLFLKYFGGSAGVKF